VLSIFILPLILLRRGYFKLSVMFIVAVFLILISTAIATSNLRAVAESLTFFTLCILLAGLLVGRAAMFVTYAISAAVVLVFALNEPDPALRLDYIAVAGNFILLNGLVAAFVNSFGITLRNALHSSLQREQEINSLFKQLQSQVAELERFTYTVSHDLRNPLVTIKGFLGMLKSDLMSNRSDRLESDFQRIEKAADKMDALLTDLLELSRIGRIVNPPEDVDLVRLAEEAVESLDARIRSKNVTVNISPNLPTVRGDRLRLREVFENLIDNAAKYSGSKHSSEIEIGARDGVNDRVIYVRDDGMGIDPKFHTRIFTLFEKLDPTMEGTGIGLALVKRIVEVHGGKIWVESDGAGKGSTFCFTIPEG